MINSYCRSCGLFISVQDEFAGGKGTCPRCKIELRIPRPWPPETPDWVDGLRFLAEPAQVDPPPRAVLVTPDFGPSGRYRCEDCGERFESLAVSGSEPGQCPRCGTPQPSVVREVIFPRVLGAEPAVAPAGPADAPGWEMVGEFLLAHPAADQSPGDDVISGRPLRDEAGGPQVTEAEVHGAIPADMEAAGVAEEAAPSAPSAGAPSPKPAPKPAAVQKPVSSSARKEGWSYLMKGQQHGPMSTAALQELLRDGKVNRSVLVWRKGMDGWVPMETVPSLVAEDGVSVVSGSAAAAPRAMTARETSSHCGRMLWGFLLALGVLLVLVLTHELFDSVGSWAFPLATTIFALVCAAGLIVGMLQAYRIKSALVRLPMGLRLQCLIGIAGLGGCVVAAMLMVLIPSAPKGEPSQQDLEIAKAQKILDVLTQGNRKAIENLVDWNQLQTERLDFKTFSDEEEVERHQAIQEFLSTFQDTYNPERLPAASFTDWRVDGKTVSAAYGKGSQERIEFTLQGGWLVAIRRD